MRQGVPNTSSDGFNLIIKETLVKTKYIHDPRPIWVNFDNFGLWGHRKVKTEKINDPGPIWVNFEIFGQWGLARVKAETIHDPGSHKCKLRLMMQSYLHRCVGSKQKVLETEAVP